MSTISIAVATKEVGEQFVSTSALRVDDSDQTIITTVANRNKTRSVKCAIQRVLEKLYLSQDGFELTPEDVTVIVPGMQDVKLPYKTKTTRGNALYKIAVKAQKDLLNHV